MGSTLNQQNGQNWRNFVIEDERLVLTSSIEGMEQKFVLPFAMGIASPDYDETVIKERVFFGKMVGVWLGAMVLVMFGSFPLLGQEDNQALISLGLLLLAASLVGLFIVMNRSQPKNIGGIRVSMGDAQIHFYSRSDKDRDQVKAFVDKLIDVQKAYFKEKYLTYNDAQAPDQIKARLSWLYENQLIDDQELARELKKLPH
ncbi:MAG TPA: hypothetical protein VK674_04550 [Candidatus Limnocylindria bacterium]|nr:hypothetical protein [Candidatus Limnocylindria bacterium]